MISRLIAEDTRKLRTPSPFRQRVGERVRVKLKSRSKPHQPSPNLSLKGEGYGVHKRDCEQVFRIPVLCLVLLALTACGFEPVYSTHKPDSSRVIDNVLIDPMQGRDGQVMRTTLEDLISPTGPKPNARYALAVTLDAQQMPAVIGDDGTVRRYSQIIIAAIALRDLQTGQEVYKDALKRYGSYSVTGSDYGSFMIEQDVHKRTIEELAHDIVLRVSGFLTRQGEVPL